ncbi:MAG: hypothetical protein ABSE70_05160 [Candidatus Limnocylindrales bacterium]
MLLRKRRFFAHCRLAQEPGVLVWRGVDSDDLRTSDIECGEDLVEGFLPQTIRDSSIAPEGPEVCQGPASATEA